MLFIIVNVMQANGREKEIVFSALHQVGDIQLGRQ